MRYGGTMGLIVALLQRRSASVRYLATRYGISDQEVERLINRLKSDRSDSGNSLYVSGYAWRASKWGGRYVVPLYRYGTGESLSMSVWLYDHKQIEQIPALGVVAQRVKRGRFQATPWDGILRPILSQD